jgi:lysophospholipase L1-like esterase
MWGRCRAIVKTLCYNFLVFFVLGNVFYWSIPTIVTLQNLYKRTQFRTAKPFLPPTYSNDDAAWLESYKVEMTRLKTVYKSFIGWRTDAAAGETINIQGPYLQRKTVNAESAGEKKAYFFGGSTMWGMGANDAGTIPSQFSAITAMRAENFGELAYTAHQNLALLIQLLQAGHRPDLVVFYDGVNDVAHKCRIELGPDSHEREYSFSNTLRRSTRTDSFSYYFAPLIAFGEKANNEISRGLKRRTEEYDCNNNPAKAEAIADRLIQDWQFAKQLVESRGGKFVGILQPVAYFSQTRTPNSQKEFEPSFRAVYPMIREKMRAAGEFHDLVSVFDIDEYIYNDFCHVAPKGNRLVAQKIADIVAPLGFRADLDDTRLAQGNPRRH